MRRYCLARNTMKIILLTTAALAALTSGAIAAPAHAPKPGAARAALICPVTGDKIASAAKSYAHETYKGRTYYFCCPDCKPRFDKNRAGTVASAKLGKYQKM